MADHESDIATFLTLDGHVFIALQYEIAYDKELNEGGACPDFVALDLKHREVIVVEVTMAANMDPLTARIMERQSRWYLPIRQKMREVGVVDETWKPTRFLGFVRAANFDLMKRRFHDQSDVAFYAIEKATFLWEYWDRRMKEGLPR